jgi:hypothetical protein
VLWDCVDAAAGADRDAATGLPLHRVASGAEDEPLLPGDVLPFDEGLEVVGGVLAGGEMWIDPGLERLRREAPDVMDEAEGGDAPVADALGVGQRGKSITICSGNLGGIVP